MKKLIILSFLGVLVSGCVSPGKSECKAYSYALSPAGQVITTVAMVTNPAVAVEGALALSGATYRQADCPRDNYMTEEQVRKMIEEKLEKEK